MCQTNRLPKWILGFLLKIRFKAKYWKTGEKPLIAPVTPRLEEEEKKTGSDSWGKHELTSIHTCMA